MTIAKWIIAFVALYGFGGVFFDAVIPATARQHLWNPAWPPHAKFHNAQTMLMGVFGSLIALLLLFASGPLTLPVFFVATGIAASYWVGMVLAQAFPGTAWCDPEFEATNPHPLGFQVQQLLSYGICGLVAVAIVLAAALH